MTDTLIKRIKSLLDEQKLSERETCLRAGVGVDTIRDIRRGGGRAPGGDKIAKLATALGTTTDWLLTGHGDTRHSDLDASGQDSATQPAQKSPQHSPTMPTPHDMPRDIEVLGTAAGSLGEGAFQIANEIIDRVRRPPGIAEAVDIYALYVVGSSMEPRYAEGELVYVSARRPARIGDYVIVQVQHNETDGVQTYIKRLARRTAEKLMLEQHNPLTTIEIKMTAVKAIHRILTMNDLMGV